MKNVSRRAWLLPLLVAVTQAACGGFITLPRASTIASTPAPPASSGPIEAGCSLTIQQVKGDVGSVLDVDCPAYCSTNAALLVGTDVYADASGICIAAIHAGALSESGGRVAVRIEPGRPAYRGSTRHGVQSTDFGAWGRSFSIVTPVAAR